MQPSVDGNDESEEKNVRAIETAYSLFAVLKVKTGESKYDNR
jgi:hypothetical protein